MTSGEITGQAIHTATARSSTPKNFFTFSIHRPDFGRNAPSETPTTSNGTPMPIAIEKSAPPPSSTSLVWLI